MTSEPESIKKKTAVPTDFEERSKVKLVESITAHDLDFQTILMDELALDGDAAAGIQPDEALQALLTAAVRNDVNKHAESKNAASKSELHRKSSEAPHAGLILPAHYDFDKESEASKSGYNAPNQKIANGSKQKDELLETFLIQTQPFHVLAQQIWTVRAPLLILLSIAFAPKLVLIWVGVIVFKPLVSYLYKRSPVEFQIKLRQTIPPRIRHSPLIKDYGEGADQGLPFVLFWTYLFCAPFAMCWLAFDYVRTCLPQRTEVSEADKFVFPQNRKRNDSGSETNFYHSKAFALVIFAFVALGIPAFTSHHLYKRLGIEQAMQNAKLEPVPRPVFASAQTIHKTRFLMVKRDSKQSVETVPNVDHVKISEPSAHPHYRKYDNNQSLPLPPAYLTAEPKESSFFFEHFYLVGLASTLSVLFLRAWLTFPLNFLTDEHSIYVTARGVRRSRLRNWFLNVITINRWAIGGGPDSLDWNEIKALRKEQEGYTKLFPLPERAFSRESLTYKLLNKLAAFVDGVTARMNNGHYLLFSTESAGSDFGRHLRINLNELSKEQRAKLFYSVKQWAPKMVIPDNVQEELLGSSVLKDVRYTQLWFDLFTTRSANKRRSVLTPGESLMDGKYVIQSRLNSGGQATAYLAETAGDVQCVLKEFILAGSASNPGALLESAREFENEVTVLSQLEHPGIVNLIDFFTESGRVYVVLEYVNGETLRQKVSNSGPLSEAEVARIASSISQVLQYLHNFDPPIVHRDVSPENVLITADGAIKLIDFSLAEKADGRSTTDSCGKQAFTPPEQFRDEACPQSDIYGLGATMYFMLTGSAPKPITVSSPSKKMPSVSSEMNSIVERATQLDLCDRYESVQWLQLELAKICTTRSDSSSQSDSES